MYQEIKGDLIALAKEGKFDVVVHGCNCFCVQGAGIAAAMVEAFNTNEFPLEDKKYKGDINKLGQIDTGLYYINKEPLKEKENYKQLYIVNAYTQYNYGRNHVDGDLRPLDYNALALCLKKINHVFSGLKIGLPKIGCGLAGGEWKMVKNMIKKELKDCDVTIVIYE